MKLSIVIPAYNEEPAIRAGKLASIMDQDWPFEVEIILVDDGSTDQTHDAALQVLTGCPCYVYRIEHAGKAAALIAGMRMALGDYILTTDLDQATPITELANLLLVVQDVAIGSRGLWRPGAPISRYVLSAGQVIAKRLLLGLPFVDTQCGFKLWSRSVAMHCIEHLVIYNRERLTGLHGPCVSSGFDVEMLLVARRLGYKVIEVPVEWHHQPSRRVNFARDASRGMMDLIHILAADLAGLYPHKKLPSNHVRTMLETRNQ